MNSKYRINKSNNNYKEIRLLFGLLIVLIWSFINANDYFAWVMLTIPATIYVGSLIFTYKKFKFTYFAYFFVFLHIVILLIGAKYTYTFNPLFAKLQDVFDFSRNHYDRIGHFAQGFAPAILVREFLLRKGYFKKSVFFYITVSAFVLGASAAWELLEFFATIISNNSAEYMLSTQGDFWDTQWDMVMALAGCTIALVFLGRRHDKWIYLAQEKQSIDFDESSETPDLLWSEYD